MIPSLIKLASAMSSVEKKGCNTRENRWQSTSVVAEVSRQKLENNTLI